MASLAPCEPLDVKTQLNYFVWNDQFLSTKPYIALFNVPEGIDQCNFETRPGPEETIHDMRGAEPNFTLDRHAFCVRRARLELDKFDRETVKREYLPWIERFLMTEIEGASEIVIFDWRLRSSKDRSDFADGMQVDLDDTSVCLGPIGAVHIAIDQSDQAAAIRVQRHMGSRASDLLNKKQRYRIINVWRPICDRVEDWPLAVCDGSTLSPPKMMVVDHVRRSHIGEAIYPIYDSRYRWHYLSQQRDDEILVMKMFDSEQGVAARHCAHTAFRPLGKGLPNPAPRESIEVRALVF
ncbi:hypothetical protein ABEF95_004542 [Exophiala dermatitidis]